MWIPKGRRQAHGAAVTAHLKEESVWDSPGGPLVKNLLLQGARVLFRVGELRSLQGTVQPKKKKKRGANMMVFELSN